MEDIFLIGYGGHGKSVENAIRSMKKYNLIGYTDKNANISGDLEFLGTDEAFEKLYKKGVKNAAIGIGFMGNGHIRDDIYRRLMQIGFKLPPIVDASAIIAENAEVSEGVFIGKKAVVNSYAKIGKMAIINTGGIVEHECVVNDFSHVAVGAVLCGNVILEDHCFIGAGATIIQGIKIGKYAKIGAGSVIINDIESGSAIVGVPGKKI